MINTELEALALELANLDFTGMSRDQIRQQMNARLCGLDRLDAEMVVAHAAAIAREQAAAKLKEAAALDAFGCRNGADGDNDAGD